MSTVHINVMRMASDSHQLAKVIEMTVNIFDDQNLLLSSSKLG